LDALSNRFGEAIGFQLSGMEACHDFVVYPCPFATRSEWEDFDIPDSQLPATGLRLIVSGFNSALCLFEIDLKRIRKDFKRQQQYEKAGNPNGSITKSFFSFVASGLGYNSTTTDSGNTKSTDGTVWNRQVRIVSLLPKMQFFDEKRRILRLSMDPFKSLVACADTLGRVTLFDTHMECIIRIWKGLRDSYLGWIVDTAEEESTIPLNIHNERLVIFAPLLGLVSLYQMRNGPCLRVIPVGMNCRLSSLCSFTAQNNPR
jgi:hypothetical protein